MVPHPGTWLKFSLTRHMLTTFPETLTLRSKRLLCQNQRTLGPPTIFSNLASQKWVTGWAWTVTSEIIRVALEFGKPREDRVWVNYKSLLEHKQRQSSWQSMTTLGDQPTDPWKHAADDQGGLDHPWRVTELAVTRGAQRQQSPWPQLVLLLKRYNATYNPFWESVGLNKFMCIATEKLEKRLKLYYFWLGMFPLKYLIITVLPL